MELNEQFENRKRKLGLASLDRMRHPSTKMHSMKRVGRKEIKAKAKNGRGKAGKRAGLVVTLGEELGKNDLLAPQSTLRRWTRRSSAAFLPHIQATEYEPGCPGILHPWKSTALVELVYVAQLSWLRTVSAHRGIDTG